MMELVPEQVEGAIVLNVISACPFDMSGCGSCPEYAVGIHNWLMLTELKYLVVDLQDEKEVCPSFLEELLQLRKRLRIPFLFAGVMDKPRKVLESYNFLTTNPFPPFTSPEQAIKALRSKTPNLDESFNTNMKIGEPIPLTRPRHGGAREDFEEGTDNEEADV